ncbi:MAG: hypothetical protein PF590_08200 [Candidatus Delongbacteria bacterium]|jgi:NRPS condensation-like uncharacterized protein|nr:hypothetical protein [Candidatus Delongbacteria bacterium]
MEQKRFWLKLDNAAKIFPAVSDSELTSVFRISINLKERVKVAELQRALDKTYQRFPYFNIHLKHGFFWHYLEQHKGAPKVEIDAWPPLQVFYTTFIHERLYRIMARGRQISIEMMHSVSDGGGAIQFLNSLLWMYLRECGHDIEKPEHFMDINEQPEDEEFEDAYNKYFMKGIPPIHPKNKAWSLPFSLKNKKPRLSVIQAEMSSQHILEKAKFYNVSVTEFLASVYLDAMQSIFFSYEKNNLPQKLKMLRMQVPINLRKIFPSKTMRNFTLFALPEVDLSMGAYSMADITQMVHHYMKLESYPQQIHRIISRNVGSEQLFYVRVIPLFIKDMILAAKHKSYGNAQYSGVMTNLGQIRYPDTIARHVDSIACLPPPPNKRTKVNCSIVSFKNKMIASFCNITSSTELEHQFLTTLVDMGVPVKFIGWNDVKNP